VRPIRWLHISDFHLRTGDSWSHDVVLKAMCDDVARQRKDSISADFILATGDLAFSGSAAEYKLAASFFDAVCTASGVPKERIFCIPGNHDIDRERQKLAFQGGRHTLQSPNHVDLLLSPGEDLKTILERQKNYRTFQRSYFGRQERKDTPDGLGYISTVTIEDVRIAILGLDEQHLFEMIEDGGPLLYNGAEDQQRSFDST
jgi:DNA repair exonuclease SbcCD nuclease subunit